MYFNVAYCTIRHYNVLQCSIMYYIVLYCTIMYHNVLQCTILYYNVLKFRGLLLQDLATAEVSSNTKLNLHDLRSLIREGKIPTQLKSLVTKYRSYLSLKGTKERRTLQIIYLHWSRDIISTPNKKTLNQKLNQVQQTCPPSNKWSTP